MANAITNATVCRAVGGLVQKQNWEAFVRVGGDYRALQNSTSIFQRIINWLAQCFDEDYDSRTLDEVSYKKTALGRDLKSVAVAILSAPLAADRTVHIEFEIDRQAFEIVSYPGDPGKLFVRHQWNEVELEGVNLSALKVILLKQYIRLQRQSEDRGEQSDLTNFNLKGLDLRDMDLTNCSLPDLSGCLLTGIEFDMTTNFNSHKRFGCEIDKVTVDRLQQHEILSAKLVVPEFSNETSEGYGKGDQVLVSEIQKISTYNYGQIFSSDNPDLATEKRILIRHSKQIVIKCFEEMRKNGLRINLTYVDLSDLNLKRMDLSSVNLYGAKLNYTNLEGANLICSDLRHAKMWFTDIRGAEIHAAQLDRAEMNVIVRREELWKLVVRHNGKYDQNHLPTERLNECDLLVHCTDI